MNVAHAKRAANVSRSLLNWASIIESAALTAHVNCFFFFNPCLLAQAPKFFKCHSPGWTTNLRAAFFCHVLNAQLITESLVIMQTLEAAFPEPRRMLPDRETPVFEEAVRWGKGGILCLYVPTVFAFRSSVFMYQLLLHFVFLLTRY